MGFKSRAKKIDSAELKKYIRDWSNNKWAVNCYGEKHRYIELKLIGIQDGIDLTELKRLGTLFGTDKVKVEVDAYEPYSCCSYIEKEYKVLVEEINTWPV